MPCPLTILPSLAHNVNASQAVTQRVDVLLVILSRATLPLMVPSAKSYASWFLQPRATLPGSFSQELRF